MNSPPPERTSASTKGLTNAHKQILHWVSTPLFQVKLISLNHSPNIYCSFGFNFSHTFGAIHPKPNFGLLKTEKLPGWKNHFLLTKPKFQIK